jgi:hypothetical protein
VTDDQPAWAGAVREGRWADFHGLPRDLPEDDMLAAFDKLRSQMVRHPVMLGHQTRLLADTEGFRYWLDHDGRVVMAEIENPHSAVDVGELVRLLGLPERESLGRHRRYGAFTTEYVYPTRGLGMTVAESYDDPPAFAPSVITVQLFPPTDLDRFISSLGGDDPGGVQHRFR